MTIFGSIGQSVGGPLAQVAQVAEPILESAVPGFGIVNNFFDMKFEGSNSSTRSLLRDQAIAQESKETRKDRKDSIGGKGNCGSQPQTCGGGMVSGGNGVSTLEMLAEVMGNLQEKRVKKLIDLGQKMANASDDELLKLSTKMQTERLLLDIAMEASKKLIDGIGQSASKTLQA